MKLATALQIVAGASGKSATRNVFLACGFTPLHLQTYLTAYLQLAYPESRVVVTVGLYGDLAGNVARIATGAAAAVVMEWQDLDPRLGFRSLGGWTASSSEDILHSVRARLDTLTELLRKAAQASALTIVLPRTPMAPVSFTPHWMADRLSLGIRKLVAEFAAKIAASHCIRILRDEALALFEGETFQLKSELKSGFPYSLAYADFLAEKIAASIAVPQAKKGLITDLDETLWAGILGDDGLEGIHWTLQDDAQIHGLYQQLLSSLAESGVLVGVASKNDPGAVEEALSKLTLAVKPEQLFPRVVSWERKSSSVEAILKTWNIGPQDVVFIDDSSAELEEVKSAFPELTCIQFKGGDTQYSYRLLLQLRDLFGKARLEEEDAVRASTLETAVKLRVDRQNATSEDDFLAGLQAVITVSVQHKFASGRALDLINKTNQFNLNGRRFELTDWAALESQPGRSVLVVEYLDKHGSLGRVSVLSGVTAGNAFKVDAWVMSCRAFARRIEYATLDFLFERFEPQTVELAYQPTPRNGPFRDFLQQLCGPIEPGVVKIARESYAKQSVPRFHGTKQYL